MKNIFKSLAFFFLLFFTFSCIEEKGLEISRGEIQFTITPSEEGIQRNDYNKVKVKLYREYTAVYIEEYLDLIIDEENTSSFTTSPLSIEYGNYEVKSLSVLHFDDAEKMTNPEALYIAIDKYDDRADQISSESLLPMKWNVLKGEVTNVDLEVVAVTQVIPVAELSYDFSEGTSDASVNMSGWSVVNDDPDADKHWIYKTYNDDKYAQASAYNGTAANYTSWLVSPALDLDAASSKNLTFDAAKAYWNSSTTFEVYIMDSADPATANMVNLNGTLPVETDADHTFIPSGDIDLSAYSGVQYIAFKYNAESAGSTTFRIDNFKFGFAPNRIFTELTEDFSGGVQYSPISLRGWSVVNVGGADVDRQWSYTNYNGVDYAQMNVGGDNTDYTSWLITPQLDLDGAAYKNISFETAHNNWTVSTTLKVYVADGPDPTTATLTELTTRSATETDAAHAWIESGDIDLSSFSGLNYIVFEVVGPSADGTSYRLNNFEFGFEPVGGVTPPTGGTEEAPYDVTTAMTIQDGSTAWVEGYIVANYDNKIVTDPTLATDYNVLIAASADETDITNMVIVQLKGGARTTLGVASSAGASLGKKVKFEGSLEAYYGMAGLKGVSDDNFIEVVESATGTKEAPYDVTTAMTIQDGSTAWVEGFIVANYDNKIVTDPTSATDYNVLIAASANETDITNMLIVQLKDGARTTLGVASTAGASIGTKVKFEGSLETYYGMAGLKGVSDNNFETVTD